MLSTKDKDRLLDTLEKIKPHDHLCLLYETPEEQFSVVMPFIRLGLERGEKCLYIADENGIETVSAAMREEGIDVGACVASGALALIGKQDSYLKNGSFDPGWMISYLEQAVKAAQKDGYKALRITGEMTWSLGGGTGSDKLVEYESRLNDVFPHFECLAICQYNRRKFSPEVILDVIRTHPVVIASGRVCKNFYYVPPQDFLAQDDPAKKVERFLDNILEHEKKREEAQSAWQLLNAHVDASPLAVVEWDSDFRIIRWAGTAHEVFGWKAEEVLGKRIDELNWIHPDDASSVGQVMEDMLSGRRPHIVNKNRNIRKNGKVIHCEWYNTTIRDKSGRLLSVLSQVLDVTERLRAENALKNSEARLSFALQQSRTGGWDLDLLDHTAFRTLEHDRIFGYESLLPQWTYEMFLEHVIPEDRDGVDRKFRESMETQTDWNFECRIRRMDGEIRWIWATGEHQRDESGKMRRMAGIVQDITERKLAEEEQRRTLAKYQTLFNVFPLGITIADREGDILESNRMAEKLLGLTKDDQLKRAIDGEEWRVVRPDGTPMPIEEYASVRALKENRLVENVEMGIVKACGETTWISVTAVPLDGQGVVITYGDISDRRRADEQLKESHDLLKNLACLVPGVIYQYRLYPDGSSAFPYASPGMNTIYEVTPEEVREDATPVFGRLHPEDYGHVVEKIQESARTLNTFFCEFRVNLPRQGLRWRWSQAQPQRMEDGSILWHGIISDITDIKQAEIKLKHSHDMLRYIIEHNRTSVAMLDRDLRYIYVSQRYIKDYRIKETDIIGKLHYDVFPEMPQSLKEVHQKSLAGEILSGENDPFFRADGTVDWVRWECRPWYEADVSIGGIILYTEVITDRVKAEEALKKSEERYRTILQTAMDGFWLVDIQGRILETNDTYCLMSGYSRQELLSMSINDLDGAEDKEETHRRIQKILEKGEDRFETRHRRKDGSVLDIAASVQYRDIEGGQMVVFMHDITGIKQAAVEKDRLEEQLRQAQKMESIGRLAGGVAHDFNNKLGVILGYTELALQEVDPSSSLHAELQDTHKAAAVAADLTRQLLAFARKQTIDPKLLDLNEVIEGMLKMLRRLIGEDIDLVWQPDSDIWPVRMDPSQIDQILANLCVNARDAIDGVGKVTIETGKRAFDKEYCDEHPEYVPGDYVVIAVSDDGCGMDKKTLEKLFEPFFTTKEVGKGTGLGLSMVYGAVRQNSGFITVYSEPGSGTTFKIYLPRHAGEADLKFKAVPVDTIKGGKETILLVEDDSMHLKLTWKMLERFGYSVVAVSDPDEAVKIVENYAGEINLLLTDVIMPKMNGRNLARQLLLMSPNLKMLFMSGYTANVIAHHGILDAGVNFIHKPFSMQELSAKLREVLEKESGVPDN